MALGRTETWLVRLEDESGVGEARRVARRAAAGAGLDEPAVERAALVVTEAGRNAVRHGGGGFVALRAVEGSPGGLEIVVVDRGPGIADVAAAMRDGHSTAGTAGQGLGAIRRLAATFEVWSAPGKGTAILAEVRADPAARRLVEVGVVALPHVGEALSGDAWVAIPCEGRTVLAVVDGLGHGPLAHAAAEAAVEAVRRVADRAPGEILQVAHDALRPTRGAAMAVLELADGGAVRFAGVGNISAAIVDGAASRRLVSLSGTLGHEVRRVQEFAYEWPAGALLVMHSDGLGTRWDLAAFPGLAGRAPALVAAVLTRDFARGRDDVTVLAARRAP